MAGTPSPMETVQKWTALTPHQARYIAHDLTRRSTTGLDRLSMSLFDAAVDLNPHQIEAALFALHSPLSKGVLLADEVGLGKTIEAGIVLCQFWAERNRRLLVICPASLRKQWALELEEKFNLPALVVDRRVEKQLALEGRYAYQEKRILIMSLHYANRVKEELRSVDWDLVVIDEAHKLRNAYRPSNRIGQGIRWAIQDSRKILLTASPLQNSLLELYGLSTIIDEHLFGDRNSFLSQYGNVGGNLVELRERLRTFSKRTLRNQVMEYVRYTERHPITEPFTPTDDEQALYEAVNAFLQREDSYALPERQRHLTTLILRKLLASSTHAVAATLDSLRARLEIMRKEQKVTQDGMALALIEDEELEDDLLDELLDEDEEAAESNEPPPLDLRRLNEEISILASLSERARRITTDTRAKTLLKALEVGFDRMSTIGANRKAVIFTESRRTQEYLKGFLESNGYRGEVVTYSGTNTGENVTRTYHSWLDRNRDSGRVSGSKAIDVRTALIEHFRDNASIMIATEAAAEGINLQFCSLVINYDLPWNPQRIEQRIGRCHRYGQQHDVVVINFLNERNAADRRVLELLSEKFQLFNGVFGASDEILGTIESGIDFEMRILAIYQECRTPEEIDTAFQQLQQEMDEQIQARMEKTRKDLFEHFDEDVHQRLRMQLENARDRLDRFGKRFWDLTRTMLKDRATFDENTLTFDLHTPPDDSIPKGRYHLISKHKPEEDDGRDGNGAAPGRQFLYRLSHPLGEYVLAEAKALATPTAHLVFDVTNYPTRLLAVEALRGKSGFLTLTLLRIESFETEEYLLFSGFTEDGSSLDQETVEKMFACGCYIRDQSHVPEAVAGKLSAEVERHAKGTINASLELNNEHFRQAREKLETWADDMIVSAERELRDTKDKIKALRRQARQATSLAEEKDVQEQIRSLEQKQRRQRKEIFAKEDEIAEKRDALIEQLEQRMSRETVAEPLFTIGWSVV